MLDGRFSLIPASPLSGHAPNWREGTMRRDSLTQWHLRKHPEKISRFDKVVIWSGEHRLYWRPGYCGYTGDILKAGVYDARDALAHTIHCDPEKKIALIVAPANIQQHVPPDN
jgi:hypothetical protein